MSFTNRIIVALAFLALFPILARSQSPPGPQPFPVKSADRDQNSAEGLQLRLQSLLNAAKDHDTPKLKSLIKEMEIPDYAAWFTKIFGEKDGESMSSMYRDNFVEGDTYLEDLFAQSASENGEFTFRRVSDRNPGGEPGDDDAPRKSWPGLGDPFLVAWKYRTPTGTLGNRQMGAFVYLDGGFFWLSVFKIPPMVPGTTSYPPLGPMPPADHAAGAPDYAPAAEKPPEIYHPGQYGIGYPRCVYCPDPEYTQEARHKHLEGSVVLQVIIQPSGQVTDIQIVKTFDAGLAQKAIEAVSKWRLSPARRENGEAVPVIVPIEVTFRILKRGHQ